MLKGDLLGSICRGFGILPDRAAEDLGELARHWNAIVSMLPYPTRETAAKVLLSLVVFYIGIRKEPVSQTNADLLDDACANISYAVTILALEPDSPWRGRLPTVQRLFPSEKALHKVLRKVAKGPLIFQP